MVAGTLDTDERFRQTRYAAGVKGCALLAAAAICGCGRLGFDPRGDDGGSGPSGDDAPPGSGDASGSGVTDGPMPDTLPAACVTAIEVFTNTPHRSTTCTGNNLFDGCGPPTAEEVVYKWVVPADGNYTVTSTDISNGNINSTGAVNAACTGTVSCTGISQMPYTAGQVFFFALESQSGCVTYDFLIMGN
jgi:hypothetical protein